MSGDIVERLRNWDDGGVSTHYEGFWDLHPVCAILLAADAIEARDAEIERLRAEFSAVLGDAIAKDAEVGAADALANTLRALVAEQHDEIERLRAALALAVGELSTHHEHRLASPVQLMQQLLNEARNA